MKRTSRWNIAILRADDVSCPRRLDGRDGERGEFGARTLVWQSGALLASIVSLLVGAASPGCVPGRVHDRMSFGDRIGGVRASLEVVGSDSTLLPGDPLFIRVCLDVADGVRAYRRAPIVEIWSHLALVDLAGDPDPRPVHLGWMAADTGLFPPGVTCSSGQVRGFRRARIVLDEHGRPLSPEEAAARRNPEMCGDSGLEYLAALFSPGEFAFEVRADWPLVGLPLVELNCDDGANAVHRRSPTLVRQEFRLSDPGPAQRDARRRVVELSEHLRVTPRGGRSWAETRAELESLVDGLGVSLLQDYTRFEFARDDYLSAIGTEYAHSCYDVLTRAIERLPGIVKEAIAHEAAWVTPVGFSEGDGAPESARRTEPCEPPKWALTRSWATVRRGNAANAQ